MQAHETEFDSMRREGFLAGQLSAQEGRSRAAGGRRICWLSGRSHSRSSSCSALALILIITLRASASFGVYVPTNLVPPTVQREFRGAWVATLNNIDWP